MFSHRSPRPQSVRQYRNYRSQIREDFHECCAFCLLHELFNGGESAYQLDHFRPQSRYPHLITEYTNLYYACAVCNGNKRDRWPTSSEEAGGYRFFDSCRDGFSNHFEEVNGTWNPKSRVGKYTVDHLRLNSRHLRQIRRHIQNMLDSQGVSSVDWDRPMKLQIMPILQAVSDEILDKP